MVDISVLGPVQVTDPDGAPVAVDRPVLRRLLAALTVRIGRVASVHFLTDALWAESPPPSARASLHSHVSRLRVLLGKTTISSSSGGYRLDVDPGSVDAIRFELLFSEARDALLDRRYEIAQQAFSTALGLWRGTAYEEFKETGFVGTEARRLDDMRLTCVEDLVEARIELGEHRESLAELDALLHEHPFRERLWGQRMLALYRSGRQADALAAYRQLHRLLTDEIGVEPNQWVQALHAAMLVQSPELERPSTDRLPGFGAVPGHRPLGGRAAPPPDIRYAARNDVHIAFQVLGDGDVDIVYAPSYLSHLEIQWEWPAYGGFLHALAGIGRLIVFDKRGMGLSDRTAWATPQQWASDLVAVLDSVGSSRAIVLGASEGAATAVHTAHAYPDRVAGLVLFGCAPTVNRDDYTIGTSRERYELTIHSAHRRWGTGRSLERFAPSAAGDPAARAWYGRMERHAVSPGGLMDLMRVALSIDYRFLLPQLTVPTLVLHRRDEVVPLAGARYVAQHTPGARLVELEGIDHLVWFGDWRPVVEHTAGFAREVMTAGRVKPAGE
jgi:DNA-binding SARP family transcriptional activator/pimeloyl-ACP methyl ester carboxylesterase